MNADQLEAWLKDFARTIDFTRPGKDQSLGRDIISALALNIQRRAAVESSGARPSGRVTPFAPLKPDYRREKQRLYGIDGQPNFRTGQMLSLASLIGKPRITPHALTMVYGLEMPPSRSVAPTGRLSAEDEETLDTDKARYAHKGTKHRIARPFYALAAGEDPMTVHEIAQEWVWEYLQKP